MSAPPIKYGEVCGWTSDFKSFSSENPKVIRGALASFVRDASESQVRAWDDSIPVLQGGTREAIAATPEASGYTAILEYQLPLESRRPDVILLENGNVVVIEFKGKDLPSQADIDQVSAYARDLRCYHRECANRDVVPVLVPMRYSGPSYQAEGTWIVSRRELDAFIKKLAQSGLPGVSVADFLRPEAYSPLPTLVRAARELFESGSLRRVYRACAATDPAVNLLSEITKEAARTKTRRLVLLTGLPGAGKTLVGLRLVHAGFLDALAVDRGNGKPTAPAVFLSGNGPLVEVLQYELRRAGGNGKTFVRGVKDYVKTYSKNLAAKPPEHVLVFDEAQRAWDATQVSEKHPTVNPKSEPEHFVEFAQRIPEWCVVLGLIGTGQEIHKGEEGGLIQWRRAIEDSPSMKDWTIHAPPAIMDVFAGSPCTTSAHGALSLDTEIRYHLAPHIHSFVDGLLNGGEISKLKATADGLFQQSYQLHVTRNLDEARRYALERYAEYPEARFGLLASSRDRDLPQFGVLNGFQDTKNVRIGPWFSEGQGVPESCRQLARPITEFGAQGLELDLGIICWGTDFLKASGKWSIANARRYMKAASVKDAFTLRLNSYRVLLTRGRDGNVVFVPPMQQLDDTYNYLLQAGFRVLKQPAL